MTPGTIYVDAVGSSAGPFFYWIRYVTRDGVMGAWNAVDGISASTSADPRTIGAWSGVLSSTTALAWGFLNWTGRLPEPTPKGLDPAEVAVHGERPTA